MEHKNLPVSGVFDATHSHIRWTIHRIPHVVVALSDGPRYSAQLPHFRHLLLTLCALTGKGRSWVGRERTKPKDRGLGTQTDDRGSMDASKFR